MGPSTAAGITFAVVLAAAAGLARADDLRVPGDFGDLQEALDSARPGDRVLLERGTHRGTFVVDVDDVEIVGTPGARLVGERGEDGTPLAIVVTGDGVTLRDLTIRSGGVSLAGRDGAVDGCTFRRFSSPAWTGVVTTEAGGTVSGNDFGRGCRGAASVLVLDRSATVTDNDLDRTRTDAAIVVWADGTVVSGNDIRAPRGGLGIDVRADGVALVENDLRGAAISVVGHGGLIDGNLLHRSPAGRASVTIEGDAIDIVDNVITDGEDTGVVIVGDDHSLTGNEVLRPGSSRHRGDFGHGIVLFGDGNLLVSDVVTDARGEGIALQSAVSWEFESDLQSVLGGTLAGNTVVGCASTGAGSCGLGNWTRFTSVTDCTFTGNVVDVVSDEPFAEFSGNVWSSGGPEFDGTGFPVTTMLVWDGSRAGSRR